MLIDLHTHSSGISKCCRINAPEVIRQAQEAGLDAIVLTNHYQEYYLKKWNTDVRTFAKMYVDEYEYARRCGEKIGFPVHFGMEVTMSSDTRMHMLIYGVDPSFVDVHPEIFLYSQKEMYDAVHSAGGVLIQGHPFRGGGYVLDTSLLDGVEVNCHPLYNESRAEELTEIARKNHLILSCGGDYHADTYRPLCGTYIPDTAADIQSIADYLKNTDRIRLRIHEPNTDAPYETEYIR